MIGILVWLSIRFFVDLELATEQFHIQAKQVVSVIVAQDWHIIDIQQLHHFGDDSSKADYRQPQRIA
jgi:hypothetical protein